MWIELYNNSSEETNLSGWKIESLDGTQNITISSGVIAPQGYFLLERTDDSSVPDVVADFIYTGALQNSGETLLLKNSQGVTVDTAAFSSGWTYPDDLTQTLSRFGSSWGSGIPTPRAQNQPSESSDAGNLESGNESVDDTEEVSKDKESDKKIVYKERRVTIISENHGYVGVPLIFSSHVRDRDGSNILRGIFQWNMGNGEILYGNKPDIFSYTFTYPG